MKDDLLSSIGIPLVTESGFENIKNNEQLLLKNRNANFMVLMKGVESVLRSVQRNITDIKENYHKNYFSMSEEQRDFNRKMIKLYEDSEKIKEVTPIQRSNINRRTKQYGEYWNRAISFDDLIETHLRVEYYKRGGSSIENNQRIPIDDAPTDISSKKLLNVNDLKNKLTGLFKKEDKQNNVNNKIK